MPKGEILTEQAIAAAPDAVWGVMTDVNNIQNLPGNTWLKVEAPEGLTVGKHLKVNLKPEGGKPMDFTPEILRAGPTPDGAGRELRWRGKVWNSNWFFVGEHYFRVEPDGSGSKLVHGEHFTGLLVPLLGGVLTAAEKEFKAFNGNVKAKCEGGSS